jgi:CysZ protein
MKKLVFVNYYLKMPVRAEEPHMIRSAIRAFEHVFSKPLRGVLLKALGGSILLMVMLGIIIGQSLTGLQVFQNAWLDGAVNFTAIILMLVVIFVSIAPVTSMLAGIFLDEIAEYVEKTDFPHDPPGKALSLADSLWPSLKFALLVLLVNILLLPFAFVPGVNLVVYGVANGYLLGREYFTLVASRFYSLKESQELRKKHNGLVFTAGVLIAAFISIPILNLTAPLFGTALMVHVHKRVANKDIT